MRYTDDSEGQDRIQYLCTLTLIMTMFRITSQDLKYGNSKMKREARKFLKSSWFEELCGNMDLDVEKVRRTIMYDGKAKSRSSYE